MLYFIHTYTKIIVESQKPSSIDVGIQCTHFIDRKKNEYNNKYLIRIVKYNDENKGNIICTNLTDILPRFSTATAIRDRGMSGE